jgi:hypothetical protein
MSQRGIFNKTHRSLSLSFSSEYSDKHHHQQFSHLSLDDLSPLRALVSSKYSNKHHHHGMNINVKLETVVYAIMPFHSFSPYIQAGFHHYGDKHRHHHCRTPSENQTRNKSLSKH